MAKVLVVGCGDLGGEIARLLSLSGDDVIGVRASAKPLEGNIPIIQADVTQADMLTALQRVYPEILIYCVAASRQSDENYHAIYVQGFKNVLATQANNDALRRVLFVSSTRVYGQNTDEILNEDSPAIPSDFGGMRMLEAENLLDALSCEVVRLRLSGIYGKGRERMLNLAKTPSAWPQNAWSNRIHRDDAARFIAYICGQKQVASCYLVTDDMPVPQHEVLLWLAGEMGVDVANMPPQPVQGGKRLSNQRLRDTSFNLQYPYYQIGYRELL